mgnify:CR=1 FL=1
MTEYAHPEKLVSTDWVAEHGDDPNVVIAESDEDVLLYHTGHIPGAVKLDWLSDLIDEVVRDYLSPEELAALCSAKGITPETTVVFYGDNHNWWAAYALWVFSLFGHTNVKLIDGGRQKWIAEERELTTEVPDRPTTDYPVPTRDDAPIRAFIDDAVEQSRGGLPLIDVRSPEEFSGERMHMPDYPNEGALRGGHIPGAANVPWKRAAADDGTFRSRSELESIYQGEAGLSLDDEVVVYCRIGERSSHTWFVLTHLLGYERVRNYDGSWTEYGNAVRVPIER